MVLDRRSRWNEGWVTWYGEFMKFLKKSLFFVKRAFQIKWIFLASFLNFKLTFPQRARIFCERAGGAFAKLGHVLALRNDLLSFSCATALLGVKEESLADDFETMDKVFIAEKEMSAKNFFAEIDTEPVFAGPVAQVYFAKLKTGEKVAVKIQRPGVQEKFEVDFFFINLWSEITRSDISADFISWARQEFDFTYEAKNADVIYEHSKEHPQTIIPKQYLDLTTPKVLVHEFIEGGVATENILLCKIDKRELSVLGIDVDFLVNYLIKDEMRQYFMDGFFHADPQPANVLFMPGNKLVYLDFGIVGTIDSSERNSDEKRINFLKIFSGLANKDIEAVSRGLFFFRQSDIHEDQRIFSQRDIEESRIVEKIFQKIEEMIFKDFKKDIGEILEQWFNATEREDAMIIEKCVAVVFPKVIEIAEDYGICLPREMNLFLRAMYILDIVGLRMSSNFDMVKGLNLFFKGFPVEQIEEAIRKNSHAPEVSEKISSSAGLDWEFFQEYTALENERRMQAKERIMALFANYAERHEEIRSMLKSL